MNPDSQPEMIEPQTTPVEPVAAKPLPDEVPPDKRDFYMKMRDSLSNWATTDGRNYQWVEYAVVTPDLFHLLLKLSMDKDVPAMSKALIGAGIAYFMMPIDLIPDMLPGGWLDDLAVAVVVLNYLIGELDHSVIRRNWAGQGDIIELNAKLMDAISRIVGPKLYKKVVAWVKKTARRMTQPTPVKS